MSITSTFLLLNLSTPPGIGKGLVTAYLAKANTTVIATCREVSEQITKDLFSLSRGHGSNLIIVSLSLDKPQSVINAVSQLQRHHSINKIDIVIANAGICIHYGPLARMEDADLVSHFDVNTLGPIRLFRATLPLLQASSQPKFIYISSELASITGLERSSSLTSAYGVSKVASNYLVKKIHTEHPDMIAFSIDPGYVYKPTTVVAYNCWRRTCACFQICPNWYGKSRRAVQWARESSDDYFRKRRRNCQSGMPA